MSCLLIFNKEVNVWNGYQDMFVLTLPGSYRDKNSKGLKSNFNPNIK